MSDLFDFLEKQEGRCFHLLGVGVFSIYYNNSIFLDCGGGHGFGQLCRFAREGGAEGDCEI